MVIRALEEHRRVMESLAELAFELISSQIGLAMVAAVAATTVVLSSGLAAFVVELSEAIRTERDSPLHDRVLDPDLQRQLQNEGAASAEEPMPIGA